MTPKPLDVPAALRLALGIFWRDFAPIVFLGLIFVTLPAVLARLYAGSGAGAPDPTLGTLAETFRWLLVMIFLSAVTGGVLSQFGGRVVTPSEFMRNGLRAMQPGLVVSLVIGVALVTLRIAFVLLAAFVPTSGAWTLVFVGACIAVFALWAVAIPVALNEQRMPLMALRRSADLTRGNRWRLAGLFLVIALAVLPPIMLVRFVIFGNASTPLQIAEIIRGMTITSPALWISQLTTLLIFGLLSVVPAALYLIFVGVTERRA